VIDKSKEENGRKEIGADRGDIIVERTVLSVEEEEREGEDENKGRAHPRRGGHPGQACSTIEEQVVLGEDWCWEGGEGGNLRKDAGTN